MELNFYFVTKDPRCRSWIYPRRRNAHDRSLHPRPRRLPPRRPLARRRHRRRGTRPHHLHQPQARRHPSPPLQTPRRCRRPRRHHLPRRTLHILVLRPRRLVLLAQRRSRHVRRLDEQTRTRRAHTSPTYPRITQQQKTTARSRHRGPEPVPQPPFPTPKPRDCNPWVPS